MLLAADYPFLDILWTMLIFFAWVIWFWILISVLRATFSAATTCPGGARRHGCSS